jgi:hypothetical protein
MAARPESAILAGGCFWGMQNLIRKRPRIVSTMVGCTGGDTANATYGDHGKHAEAIEINFDAEQLSHRDLLEFFFQVHDPTTKDRQGYDIGADYRSAMHLEPGVLRPHRRLRTRGLGQRGCGAGSGPPETVCSCTTCWSPEVPAYCNASQLGSSRTGRLRRVVALTTPPVWVALSDDLH